MDKIERALIDFIRTAEHPGSTLPLTLSQARSLLERLSVLSAMTPRTADEIPASGPMVFQVRRIGDKTWTYCRLQRWQECEGKPGWEARILPGYKMRNPPKVNAWSAVVTHGVWDGVFRWVSGANWMREQYELYNGRSDD